MDHSRFSQENFLSPVLEKPIGIVFVKHKEIVGKFKMITNIRFYKPFLNNTFCLVKRQNLMVT